MYKTTTNLRRGGLLLGVMSFLSLAGCLAQQADLKQTDLQLKKQIREAKAELDRMVNETRARLGEDITQLREKELASVRNDLEKRVHEDEKINKNQDELRYLLDRTSKELKEQSNLVAAARVDLKNEQDRFRAEIKAEQERLRSDQERFRSDFRDAVTKDLSKMSGDSSAQVAKLSMRTDELMVRLTSAEGIFKKINDRLDEQGRELKSSDNRAASAAQRLEAQDKTLGELRLALGEFKNVLSGLGEKIVSQDKHSTELTGSVTQQNATLAKRLDHLATELKTVTQHVNEIGKSTSDHLGEVNKNVTTVTKGLESAGDKFVGRLDAQDQRLDQIGKQVAWLQEAAKTLEAGNVKLAGRFDEKDPRLDQISKQIAWLEEAAKTLEAGNVKLAGRLNEQDQRVDHLVKQVTVARDGAVRPAGTADASLPHTASVGENGASQQTHARLMPPADTTPTFSGPSGRDAVRERYEQLLARLREGDLDIAQEGFTSFLSEHPTSELAPNARFWLGESYYGKKDYRRAIDAYERVERDHPASEKVPAALLKKGYSFLALRDQRQAAQVFQALVSRYPKTQEASKATEKLAQLKKER